MVDPCSKKSRSAWGLTLVLASPNGLVGGSRGSGGSGGRGSGGGCVEATCPASVTSRGLPWRSYRGVH